MVRYTLSKKERLSSRKAIAILFEQGRSLSAYPFRLVWSEPEAPEQNEFPIQAMFSVSKKKFPRAVDRNRIKRLLREAYRLQKPTLYDSLPAGKAYHLSLIYTGAEVLDGATIQKGVARALERWLKSITATPPSHDEGGKHQA